MRTGASKEQQQQKQQQEEINAGKEHQQRVSHSLLQNHVILIRC